MSSPLTTAALTSFRAARRPFPSRQRALQPSPRSIARVHADRPQWLSPTATAAGREGTHEKSHHGALGLPCAVEGRGHHASVRQSRHHRTADHACAEGSSRSDLCDGDAGKPGRRDRRRLQPRLGKTRRLQRPRRARPRQCDGLAVQRRLHRHADDPHRRPAGAGPRADGAGAVWSAGADGRAAGEMGGRGDAAGGSAAHRAPRRQDRHHAADRARVHLAARRHPQCRGRHRARPLHTRRYPRPSLRRIAAGAGRAHPESGAAGDHHRRRDRQERCAEGSSQPRRDARRARVPVLHALWRAIPLRKPVLHGRADPAAETGARDACALRPHDRARRRSAAHVGL